MDGKTVHGGEMDGFHSVCGSDTGSRVNGELDGGAKPTTLHRCAVGWPKRDSQAIPCVKCHAVAIGGTWEEF